MTRIGVLTGGGDVPGLNPCIKTLVYGAVERGYEVVGLLHGWAGLLDYDLDANEPQTHCVQPLTKADVRTIDRTGGTVLHTSRTNPGKVKPKDVPEFLEGQGQGESDGPFDFTAHCLAVIERLGLDWLVPIGGDDTLSYGHGSPARACQWWRCRRRWTTTSSAPTTASGSRPRSPAACSSSTSCGPRPGRTNASP